MIAIVARRQDLELSTEMAGIGALPEVASHVAEIG